MLAAIRRASSRVRSVAAARPRDLELPRAPGGSAKSPWPAKPRLDSRSSLIRPVDTRGATHNCDALRSKHIGLPVDKQWLGYDHAEQVSWNFNYRDTRPSNSGRRSADQHCACRLPRFTEFACSEWQLVVLPIGLANATEMLVFAHARKAGATSGGTGDNRLRSAGACRVCSIRVNTTN
jgi:hypothetical protein